MSREELEALRAQLGEEARAHGAATDALDQAVADYLGVNRTDLHCLDVLLTVGVATAGQLGARLGLTTGSVTAMLDRLTRLGYLVREPDPTDRRKVIVRPTAQTERLAGELYGPVAAEGAEGLSGYSADELRLLVDYLRRSRQLQERHTERVRTLLPVHRQGPADTSRR
jgi:DNA-binding MarR family transcriptional regulator